MINYVRKYIYYFFLVQKNLFYKLRFRSFALTAKLGKAYLITPKHIKICENVFIRKGCRIEGISKYNDKVYSPEIIFDSGSSCQQNLHLTCAKRIYIGKNTAIAANVTITDINHPYKDVDTPIECQDIEVAPVHIDDDCKLYNNAVILPGTKIGKHCVVGANSVVKGEYPDYTVIAGNPARAIIRYDKKEKEWIKAR